MKTPRVNPRQFKLFMTADELMDMPAGDDFAKRSLRQLSESEGSGENLYDEKLEESLSGSAHGFASSTPAKEGEDSLYEAIQKHGVLEPVEITYSDKHDKQMLTDGHHRTVSAHSVNPNMFVPVTYDTNPWAEWGSVLSTKTSSKDQSPSSYWRSYYRGGKK